MTKRDLIPEILQEEGLFMTATRIHNKLPPKYFGPVAGTLSTLRKMAAEGLLVVVGGGSTGKLRAWGLEGFKIPPIHGLPNDNRVAWSRDRLFFQ